MKWIPYFQRWLRRPEIESKDLDYAVHVTFSTPLGRTVLEWLFADYYMSTVATTDALKLAAHNGAREVIQQIIERFDRVENPEAK
jgi:hypothetical protein